MVKAMDFYRYGQNYSYFLARTLVHGFMVFFLQASWEGQLVIPRTARNCAINIMNVISSFSWISHFSFRAQFVVSSERSKWIQWFLRERSGAVGASIVPNRFPRKRGAVGGYVFEFPSQLLVYQLVMSA